MKQRNISDEKKYAEILINYFQTLPQTLKYLVIGIFSTKKHVLSAIIEAFEKHPSILNIKKRKLDSVFSFRKTTQKEVLKVILDLNTKKSCQTSDTPTKIIKLNFYVFAYLIRKHFN